MRCVVASVGGFWARIGLCVLAWLWVLCWWVRFGFCLGGVPVWPRFLISGLVLGFMGLSGFATRGTTIVSACGFWRCCRVDII